MGHGDSDIVGNDLTTVTVRTKPCWICGQYSYITMPHLAAQSWEIKEIHIEQAWPEGSSEDKQLLRTGVHPACWDQEFPEEK